MREMNNRDEDLIISILDNVAQLKEKVYQESEAARDTYDESPAICFTCGAPMSFQYWKDYLQKAKVKYCSICKPLHTRK